MSNLTISRILYATAVILGFVSGLLLLNIILPIAVSAVLGLIAGYLYEKHKMEVRYDEPFFFRLNRLDVWGGLKAVFMCVIAYQLASWA